MPTPGSDWEDLKDEEWKKICYESIELITFKSFDDKIARVNRSTGKVTGMKKGITSIKTTVYLTNGESVAFKTKVKVN